MKDLRGRGGVCFWALAPVPTNPLRLSSRRMIVIDNTTNCSSFLERTTETDEPKRQPKHSQKQKTKHQRFPPHTARATTTPSYERRRIMSVPTMAAGPGARADQRGRPKAAATMRRRRRRAGGAGPWALLLLPATLLLPALLSAGVAAAKDKPSWADPDWSIYMTA